LTEIVVTDGELRASLAAVRALGPRHAVHVAAASLPSLAGASRWARSERLVPDALADPKGFCDAMTALSERCHAAAVLPVSDAACRALLAPGAWTGSARLAAPSLEAYQRLSHKGESARLGREAGLDVPEGEEVADVEAARDVAARLGWPVIVKPVLSVDEAEEGRRKRSVACAESAASLERIWRERVAPGSALVQRVVPGTGEGLFLLRWAGETRAVFAHRRLREKPPSGGVSVLCESIAADPALQRSVERVLDACAFSGVAMAEFRSDGRRRWLMEFNARLWGSVQLAIDAGVDFPTLLVDSVLGAPASPAPRYRVGLRSRWLLGDLDHALALARGARGSDGRSGTGAALGVLLRPTSGPCRFDNPRREDVRPFLRELREWFRALG
jgi:predicted ATP-grasp superfamily ATP-dependent carboligase